MNRRIARAYAKRYINDMVTAQIMDLGLPAGIPERYGWSNEDLSKVEHEMCSIAEKMGVQADKTLDRAGHKYE